MPRLHILKEKEVEAKFGDELLVSSAQAQGHERFLLSMPFIDFVMQCRLSC